jgi:seryl-tRNA(Sec) selenium transferase
MIPRTPTKESIAALEAAIREWWQTQQATWLPDSTHAESEETDLWDDLPEVDSKVAARTTPLFEDHLGMKLDVRMIKAGGYDSIDKMINDLVPRMVAKVNRRISKARGNAA